LADLIAAAAGIDIEREHVDGPEGVRGRNSDNTRLQDVLNWVPQVSLETGLARTYLWIEEQVRHDLAAEREPAT
jgi:nucleoside-diphosphate-sugar epimerase